MKHTALLTTSMFTAMVMLSAACGGSQPASLSGSRPNIILIMADDMGYSDIGCFGGEIRTPNIDRLAAEGLRFTQFYNTSRCCPTRASLMTGLYQHQAGIGRMVADDGVPGYRGFLTENCVTIAEVMKLGGYTTLMTGKWHVGEEPPHWPRRRGFDRYFGLISGGSNYWRLDAGRKMALDDEPYTPGEGFYMTDAFTDHAVQFMTEAAQKDAPFFLYVPFTSPHWPLHAPPEDINKYRSVYTAGWAKIRQARFERMKSMKIIDSAWPLTPPDAQADTDWETFDKKDDYAVRMAVYAAQIDRMDQNIGRILDAARRLGELDNTLVLCLADNGGCHEIIDRGTPGVPAGPAESFLSYGRQWANVSNTPFRMYKHWVHEGGISTPLIAWWPNRITAQGTLIRQPGHLIDIMATCADAGGVDYPVEYNGHRITPLEGKSLLPILQGQTRTPHEALFWEHYGNKAVRQGPWKLVYDRTGPAEWELYNIETDRAELNNLAAQQPEKVQELIRIYDAWAARAQVLPYEEIQRLSQAKRQGN